DRKDGSYPDVAGGEPRRSRARPKVRCWGLSFVLLRAIYCSCRPRRLLSETKWRKREDDAGLQSSLHIALSAAMRAHERSPTLPLCVLLQAEQGLVEADERDWYANAGLFGLEDDKDSCLAALELLDQLIFQNDLRVAGKRMATHKWGMADVFIIDLEAEARWQQHAQRRKHTQHALAVGKPLHVYRQTDVAAVF